MLVEERLDLPRPELRYGKDFEVLPGRPPAAIGPDRHEGFGGRLELTVAAPPSAPAARSRPGSGFSTLAGGPRPTSARPAPVFPPFRGSPSAPPSPGHDGEERRSGDGEPEKKRAQPRPRPCAPPLPDRTAQADRAGRGGGPPFASP